MLVKKEVKTQFEYSAHCESIEEAIEFDSYLSSKEHLYHYRKDKTVFYLCDNLDGLALAKPFIKSKLEPKLDTMIQAKELKKSKDLDKGSEEGV